MSTEEKPKRGLFYKIRVTILLCILVGVSGYAWYDHHSRTSRTEWKRSLRVAYVVVRAGPVTRESVDALKQRLPALGQRMSEEMQRYRLSAYAPFEFYAFGPVDIPDPVPDAPLSDGLVDVARYNWNLERWTAKVDQAAGYDAGSFDSRIYLYAKPPTDERNKQIEGASQAGGRLGLVRVDLDEKMADFTLFVATHELLHTLGATDKYASDGQIMVPEGIPEPNLLPMYPQRFAEVMARHRAVTATSSKPPVTLDELAVGKRTAEEIRWIASP